VAQRTALAISTAFTVLILLAALGLSVRVLGPSADPVTPGDDSDSDVAAGTADRDPQIHEYMRRLQESNDALTASYRRQIGLLNELEQLRAENALLRNRDRQYQERLTEANVRLQRLGQEVGALPPPVEPPGAAPAADIRATEAQPPMAVASVPPSAPGPAEQLRPESRTLQPTTVATRGDRDDDENRSTRSEKRGRRSGDERD
jgi:hypothetical protein